MQRHFNQRLHQLVEADAVVGGGLGQETMFGEAGDRVDFQELHTDDFIDNHVDSAKIAAAHGAKCVSFRQP